MKKIEKIKELKEETEEIQDEIISLLVNSEEEKTKKILRAMKYYHSSFDKLLSELKNEM